MSQKRKIKVPGKKKSIKKYGYYFKDWADRVKARDRYTCRGCNDSTSIMSAHHIIRFTGKDEPSDFDITNGITLCRKCHLDIHREEFIFTEDGDRRRQQANIGKVHSEETREKMCIARRKRIIKPLSEEHKKKLSDSVKRTLALKKL